MNEVGNAIKVSCDGVGNKLKNSKTISCKKLLFLSIHIHLFYARGQSLLHGVYCQKYRR
jgi:hypothetical protein